MRPWTQDELDTLVSCPKVIRTPPKRKLAPDRGSRRNDMTLESADGRHRFHVFMRINDAFPENFSIGLRLLADESTGESITLLRCNGPHEGTGAASERPVASHHHGFHVHRARAENIEQGFEPAHGAETTTAYGSYEEALRYFLSTCQVQGAEDHLDPSPDQSLWDVHQ